MLEPTFWGVDCQHCLVSRVGLSFQLGVLGSSVRLTGLGHLTSETHR
jgi:hypothetical protein